MTAAAILIIEDEPICAAFIEHILKDHGYQVSIASDAGIAWQLLATANTHFEAVLLDRNLPDSDGLSLLRKIKSTPSLRNIPVIIETADGHHDSIREGLAAGAYYYLIKPLQADLLVSIVNAAVNQYRESMLLRESVRQVELSLHLLNQAIFFYKNLEEARNLARTLAQACPDPAKVVVGLQELLINAVEHGNLKISYSDKKRFMLEGRWLEEVQIRQKNSILQKLSVKINFVRLVDRITITIQDEGDGFDWQTYLELEPERAFDPHGRGIALARQISFDSLVYLGKGNIVKVEVFT